MKKLFLLSAATITLCASAATAGYTNLSGDFEITDDGTSSPQMYYVDADIDGVGGSQTVMLSVSTAPAGYSSITGDCDDNNANITSPLTYYLDADNDGVGESKTALFCTTAAPAGYSAVTGDCDDNDPNITFSITYYLDADNDGVGGSQSASFCSTTAPAGYSSSTGDCDDADAGITLPITYYLDEDNDGVGGSQSEVICTTSPRTGYSSITGDCDDRDAAIGLPLMYYEDADNDGVGGSQTILICDNKAPSGYTSVSGDCDDNDANITAPLLYYVDADNDGVGGSQTAMLCVTSAPAGYSSLTDDCNDNDASVTSLLMYYVDADNDGFGGSQTALFCTSVVPAGHSSITGDCDDANAAVNPNAIEICNGIDDNCNGQIDENTPALTPISVIDGPAGVCKNQQAVVFSVAAVSDATSYSWTVPTGAVIASGQGTNTISVNFSSTQAAGSICVTASNACVSTDALCQSLSVYTARPTTPTGINGSNVENCPGTTRSFSIPLVNNATSYTWINPANTTIVSGQGTNSIVLSFGASFTSGNLSVNASNCIGQSSNRVLTLYSTPGRPGVISGPITEVCGGSTTTYSCPSVNGATSYNWTVPADWTINSGQGTTSVSITAPSSYSSASISVAAVSACGSSSNRSITVRSVPNQPGTISGTTSNLCGSGTFTYSIAAVSGATTYDWTVPASATIVSNSGTSINVNFDSEFTTGTISVSAVNSCGGSIVRSLNVTSQPATPSAVTGETSVCTNQQNVSYSVTAVSGLSYTWTVPAGASIVTGQGTSSITVNFGSSAGRVSVIAVNSCGSSAASSRSVSMVSCRMDQTSLNQGENTEVVEPVVYPNPGNGKATIASIKFDENTFLRVFASNGQLLRSEAIPANTESWMLNLESEPNGLYLIQMETASGVKSVRYVKE